MSNLGERTTWRRGELKLAPCVRCRHKHDGPTCTAFPDGIPEETLSGDNDHTQPYPGDHGIRFEAAATGGEGGEA